MSDETIEVFFNASLELTRNEVEEAGGDFGQAVQNQIGFTGIDLERAQDEYDNYTLEQHDESVALCD